MYVCIRYSMYEIYFKSSVLVESIVKIAILGAYYIREMQLQTQTSRSIYIYRFLRPTSKFNYKVFDRIYPSLTAPPLAHGPPHFSVLLYFLYINTTFSDVKDNIWIYWKATYIKYSYVTHTPIQPFFLYSLFPIFNTTPTYIMLIRSLCFSELMQLYNHKCIDARSTLILIS